MRKLLRHIPYWYLLFIPTILVYFGLAMNTLIMVLNHNQMPVDVPGLVCNPAIWYFRHDTIHACMNASTRLKFFCDWINLDINDIGIASPGDLVLWFGGFFTYPAWYVWIVLMVRDYNRFHRVR